MDNKMTLETYGSLEEKEEFFNNEKNMVHYYRVDTTKKLKETIKKSKRRESLRLMSFSLPEVSVKQNTSSIPLLSENG